MSAKTGTRKPPTLPRDRKLKTRPGRAPDNRNSRPTRIHFDVEKTVVRLLLRRSRKDFRTFRRALDPGSVPSEILFYSDENAPNSGRKRPDSATIR